MKNSNKRLLLEDNEFDNTLVFEMALEDNEFIDGTFNDPLLALSNFKIDLNDLVFLHINIPKMNGYKLCREEIRKKDR